ncbi:uncharacterized protein LOC141630466 [Silene latifolia]|uniref:uncharacterized protein LOC141630466 n=1 Tax=Silene latifolia TaxID=37657 RepID=UPI003D76F16D
MRKPELSGRMAKWSIHLSGYDLKFEPRAAIKTQALADFVCDFCPSLQTQAEKDILTLEEDKGEQIWELNVDGASNMKGAGVGLVLKSSQGDLLVQAVRCEFKATNNEAEYEALILGLQLALDLKIRHLQVYSDSQLIVNHVNNSYASRDPTMMAYLEIAQELKLRFKTFNNKQIPRDQNVEADALAALGATFKSGTISTIPIVHVLEPAISKAGQGEENIAGTPQSQEEWMLTSTTSQEEAVDWRKPYQDWLQNNILPADKKEVRSFKMQASIFVLIDGGRSLSNKALRQGYFWPTMRKDALEYAKKCDACQRHAPVSHQPAEPLHPVTSPWPFMKWGMDIVGPLPKAPGNKVYGLAMTDYFSKWIEAASSSQVTETQVIYFIKHNIICKSGIPYKIICDNGSQFIGNKTEAFCARWNISLQKSTSRNPQSNGQAESSSKIIVKNLRKKLEEIGGKWAEELPLVLWADRTTPKVATGQTPFSLVFEVEAVIPSKVRVPTHRYGCLTEE